MTYFRVLSLSSIYLLPVSPTLHDGVGREMARMENGGGETSSSPRRRLCQSSWEFHSAL
jgi:hypothetical protein